MLMEAGIVPVARSSEGSRTSMRRMREGSGEAVRVEERDWMSEKV